MKEVSRQKVRFVNGQGASGNVSFRTPSPSNGEEGSFPISDHIHQAFRNNESLKTADRRTLTVLTTVPTADSVVQRTDTKVGTLNTFDVFMDLVEMRLE